MVDISEGSAMGRGAWRLLKQCDVHFLTRMVNTQVFFSNYTLVFYILLCTFDTFFSLKSPLPKRLNELVY